MAKKTTKSNTKSKFISCSIRQLPEHLQVEAAQTAVSINPANAPMQGLLPMMAVALFGDGVELKDVLDPLRLAFTNRYWGPEGVDLTVGFNDNPTVGFRNKWLAHANSWGEFSNVRFRWTQTSPQVRVDRQRGSGFWSYVGTDILHVGGATMNLDSFTESTPESEWKRVVRHEVGHTAGAPHEHLRKALVDRLDPNKTIAEFRRTQGWSAEMVRQQVLTPLEERSILGSEFVDEDSIMCYQISGACTKDGKPIQGGLDFSSTDKLFAAKIYPLAVMPPPPPPPPSGKAKKYIIVTGDNVNVEVTDTKPV